MHSRPLPDRHGGPACATLDLVAPLAHEATATRHTENAGHPMPGCSGAVSPLIGCYLRPGDVDRANPRSTLATATTPGRRTSTTVTRTTGTRTTTRSVPVPSADQAPPGHADLSFDALAQAYFDCRQHKRNTPSALAFEQRLEHIGDADLYETANSYFGLLRQATHSHHDRARIARLLLRRGFVVNWDMTNTFRRRIA